MTSCRRGAGRLVLIVNLFSTPRLSRRYHTDRRAAERRRGREDGGRFRLPRLFRVPTVLHVSSPASFEPIPPPTPPHRAGTSAFKKRAKQPRSFPSRLSPCLLHPPTRPSPSQLPTPPHRIQPTPETQRKQIELWKSLILRFAPRRKRPDPGGHSIATPTFSQITIRSIRRVATHPRSSSSGFDSGTASTTRRTCSTSRKWTTRSSPTRGATASSRWTLGERWWMR